jgi:pimeloyl-ACP methyl ester carboxylesterase
MSTTTSFEQRDIVSFDGTRIAYQCGGAPNARQWLVVANGYGGNFRAWTEIFARLSHYRLLVWDYRGLHRSEVPADLSRLTIADHVRDLDAIRKVEGIDRLVMAGWSVGVQVALEQYRMRRHTVRGLLLLNGSHERVLHRSMGGESAAVYLPLLIRAIKTAGPALDWTVLPVLRKVAESRHALSWLRSAGLITGEPEAIYDVMQAVLRLDYGIYAQMGLLADDHYTEDLLPSIEVPVLVTSADRDIISPPTIGKHIASRIPGARYREISGGTHYAVMEFPELYANLIDEFIAALPDAAD